MRAHLAAVEERLALEAELRDRLVRILDGLERLPEPATDEYIDAIVRITMIERHYTPEQLDQLARRREELGEEAINEVEQEWPRLFGALRSEMERGADPADPEVQRLAARYRELVAMFHGGDEGIRAAQAEAWRESPSPEARDEDLTRFIGQAHAAAREAP